jgi:hypothetical protein
MLRAYSRSRGRGLESLTRRSFCVTAAATATKRNVKDYFNEKVFGRSGKPTKLVVFVIPEPVLDRLRDTTPP